jgi:hypothetical protein
MLTNTPSGGTMRALKGNRVGGVCMSLWPTPSTTLRRFHSRRKLQLPIILLMSFLAVGGGMAGAQIPAPSGNPKIASVKSVQGNWCRPTGSSPLRTKDSIFWSDDVHYCNSSIQVVGDQIVLLFHRNPPYEQRYECATPGVCDQNQNLWIKGPYRYGPGSQPPLSPLISTPSLRSALPDIVGPPGMKWPDQVVRSAGNHSYKICQINGDEPQHCFTITPTRDGDIPVTTPGLYAMYRASFDGVVASKGIAGGSHVGSFGETASSSTPPDSQPSKPPVALLVVTASDSDVARKWRTIPVAYREAQDKQLVEERRLYLLDLYSSEAQSNAPAAPVPASPK